MFDIELAGTFLIAGVFILSLLNVNALVMETNTLNGLDVIAQEGVAETAAMMIMELNRMGYGVTGNALVTMADSVLIFLADSDQDGDVDTLGYSLGPVTELNYTENPNDRYLYRLANGTTQDVATGITALQFSYFDAAGNLTDVPEEVRSIGISLSSQTPYYFAGKVGEAHWQGVVVPKNLQIR